MTLEHVYKLKQLKYCLWVKCLHDIYSYARLTKETHIYNIYLHICTEFSKLLKLVSCNTIHLFMPI